MADYYSRQERIRQEERLKKLQKEITMHQKWLEEIRGTEKNGQG